MIETSSIGALHGKCSNCDHVFLVIALPQPLAVAAEAMRCASCPKCGARKGIKIARAEEVANG